jgi:Hydrazine synthase alpha subunit middle domain/WD40-like Beta Propeller Repeat
MSMMTRKSIIPKANAILKRGLIGLTATLLAACQSTAPDDLLLDAQTTSLIFVKSNTSSTLDNNFIGGGNTSDLYMLAPISPNGQLKNLTVTWTDGSGAVADPEVSYDGLKVIFSMRKKGSNNFDIYEMNLTGEPRLKQLTTSPFDDCDPAYLPNGKIVFSSNRRNIRDEYERREVENLFTMNADGSGQECISFNNSDDFDPFVLRDGRIGWTRWEHHGNQNRFPLFFTMPDGEGTFLLFAPHDRNFFHARELSDGKLVAVMSNMVLVDRGPLVILNSDQTTADPPKDGDYINITPNVPLGGGSGAGEGSFKYPFPLPDGRIVASFSPNGPDGDYGLYTITRDGKNLALLYNDPAMHELDAVVVAPRLKPPVRPETIDRKDSTGVFVNQNVYFRQTRDGQLRPNAAIQEIKQVMVVEGIPVPPNERNMEIGETSFERRRILGVAPVYADGSFSIRVPANTPISFNTLDSLGRAVVIKRSWLYARPGEKVTNCTGCHGPRGEKSNPNPIALNKVPTDLVVPVSRREVIAFQNALEPIIAQKCLPCHEGTNPGGALTLSLVKTPNFSVAYENLMNASHNNKEMVNVSSVPFARNSYLADVLLGTGDRKALGPHPSGADALAKDDIRKFITWMDLGGQYH